MTINLNNLTFENIGMWPRPVRSSAIAIACALLVLVAYWLDFKGQFNAIDQGRAQEKTLRQTFITKQQQVVNLNAYKEQLIMLAARFKDLLQEWPSKTQIPGLLEDISKAGAAQGLEFTHFQPLPEKQMDFYAELPINITVVGGYHQLAGFVSQLALFDHIVTLHDLSIKPYEERPAAGTTAAPKKALLDKLELIILAKTYRYTGEETK